MIDLNRPLVQANVLGNKSFRSQNPPSSKPTSPAKTDFYQKNPYWTNFGQIRFFIKPYLTNLLPLWH